MIGEIFGSDLTALIVEDEEVIQDLLEELLEASGFRVLKAHNVAEARNYVETERFDVALIDKNLPDGNGLEVARLAKELPHKTAVMLMTGYASLESAVESVRLKVDDYLTKPFSSLDDVMARVKRVVDVLRLERDNHRLVNELQHKNARLESLVVRDPLTELFNHAFFQETLEREIHRSARHELAFSVLLIDLDRFKTINDERGHNVGDEIMRCVAGILKSQSRLSDHHYAGADEDLAARFGPDVFALTLPETTRSGGAAAGERLRAHVAETLAARPDLPNVTISVGVAEWPTDARDRGALLQAAQVSLRAAKRSGRNRVVSYSPSLVHHESSGGETHEVEKLMALDRSLEESSFLHVYQPIVRAGTNEIFAYESLCRPTDPGFAHVGELLGTAERAGRLADLGRVLRRGSVESLPKLPEPAVLFLNIHPMEFDNSAFLDDEPEVLSWASRIVLEVTESAAIHDSQRFRAQMARLKSMGFRIALDDLGAGYAGLNSLATIEPDFVKLDIGLISGIGADSRHARLVKHILEYAQGEGMMTIAEGIETAEERCVVEGLGCPLMQGYFFARPAPPFCEVDPAAMTTVGRLTRIAV